MRIFKDRVRGQGREKNCRCGFTLIELIVVMAIISILAGLTMPALRTARLRAREASARAMIASLQMALSMYETDFGVFPPEAPAGPLDNEYLVERLANETAHGGNLNWKGPYIDFNMDDLRDYADPTDPLNTRARLVDPWGNRYFYSPVTRPTNAPVGLSYWIYSFGPDKANNDGGSDDINNW